MTRDELYRVLDIDTTEDFQYFENMAELMEHENEIGNDLIYGLLQDLSMETFLELMEHYFEDIQGWVPEGETDFYMMMENIRRSLSGMTRSILKSMGNGDIQEVDDTMVKLADEICRFREWYSLEKNVECTHDDTGDIRVLPVRDALTLNREEKLGGESWRFDFSQAMEYELEDYIMSFADLAELEQ